MRCQGVARGIRGSTANKPSVSFFNIRDKRDTNQRSIRGADGVVVLAQVRRTSEVDTSDGDVEFLCDAHPFRACAGVCVCVVCHGVSSVCLGACRRPLKG
jgi:hypothetical protein